MPRPLSNALVEILRSLRARNASATAQTPLIRHQIFPKLGRNLRHTFC